MAILPLKAAYRFAEEKGLEDEVAAIKECKNWQNIGPSSTTQRRAFIFDLFKKKRVLQEFEKRYWQRVNKEKYEEYEGIVAQYDHPPFLPPGSQRRRIPHRLELVTVPYQIAQNLRMFNERAMDSDHARRTLSQTEYWVYDATEGIFAPSKFSGIAGMDVALYEQAVLDRDDGLSVANFAGSACREAIEDCLGKPFEQNKELAALLDDWGRRLFGSDVFKGTTKEKWRFISVEESEDDEDGYQAATNHQADFISVDDSVLSSQPPPRQPIRASSTTSLRPPRNPHHSSAVLQRAGYTCAIDETHQSFLSPRGHRYMEAHHLIPMHARDDFDLEIDHPRNIVCLCPLCHKQVHHGRPEDQKNLIKRLFQQKKTDLEAYNVRLEDVLRYYRGMI